MASKLPMLRTPYDWLRDEIDNTFDRWLTRRPGREGEPELPAAFTAGGMPRIDMEEDDREFRVTAELPGLNKDDFKVELTSGRLSIHGEKKATHEEKKRNYHYTECSYGSFSRVIPLPGEVDESKVEATYKNGILSIRLPKSEQSKAKPVDVQVAA